MVSSVTNTKRAEARRYDPANMADTMYGNRVRGDKASGKQARHANPEARNLYLAGVHDALEVLLEWQKTGMDPLTLSALMCQLNDQTKTA